MYINFFSARICGGILSLVTLICLSANTTAADAPVYDDELPRKATTVIPASLVSGDTWTVGPEVIPFEGLFEFQVATRWGDFPVYGEAMLRLRLKEFRAIAEMEEISDTEASLKGASRSVKKSFVRLGNAFIHPKQTAKAIPQGTRRMYSKLERYAGKIKKALQDSDEDEEGETEVDGESTSGGQKAAVWLARKYGGVGSNSRRWARKMGVDPYTSNQILAEELERLSRAEAVGSVSTKFLLPMVAGGFGLLADAANIAYIKNWREIFVYNAEVMGEMGIPEEMQLAFQTQEFYTPMTQTLLIAMLDAMEGVENRGVVIEQATLLANESEALFFLESVMLAEWYHREQSTLKRFVLDTLIPVATNEHGNLVAFTAADYFYWTAETEAVTRDFTATYAAYSGGRELVTADYVSPLARRGAEGLGWSVNSELRLTYDVEIPWGKQDRPGD